MLRRRLVSLTVLGLATVVTYTLAPMLILVTGLLSTAPRFRSLPHALLFTLGFLFYESTGVVRLTWVWLRYRNSNRFLAENQIIQYWWAAGLLRLGQRIYQLQIEVTGKDAVPGPTALLIARHTSIADTVLPMIYFAEQRGEGLRYILKQELAVMPCLDIAGHRLPNLFVDRSGADTERELDAIRGLTEQAARANLYSSIPKARASPPPSSSVCATPELNLPISCSGGQACYRRDWVAYPPCSTQTRAKTWYSWHTLVSKAPHR